MCGYDDFLELIQAEAVSEGLDEIRLAREEFHKLTGEFDEGESWYDLRMHMFLDWYLLDRVGPQGLTPTELYLVHNRARLSPEATAQVINLTVTLRSIFRIARIRGDELLLHDLTGGGHWSTIWTLPTVGLKVGDLIDSRIVRVGDKTTTGQGWLREKWSTIWTRCVSSWIVTRMSGSDMSTSTPPTRCSRALLAGVIALLAAFLLGGADGGSPQPDSPQRKDQLPVGAKSWPVAAPLELSPSSPPAQRGIALGLYSEDPDWPYGYFFDEMKSAGASHVAIVVPWYMKTSRSDEIFEHPRFTVPMRTVEKAIADARARKLEVFLFPILRVENKSDGGWRGSLEPKDVDAFFRNYTEYILRFARVAQTHGVPVLSVGSELNTMDLHEGRWRRIIAAVRQVYQGQLTYSANWDHYYEVRFWDALDHAGVTGYFELADKHKQPLDNPTLQQLIHAWREHYMRLMRWQYHIGKPLILTEVGYLSQRGAAARPWNEGAVEPLDLDLQRRCYEAFRRVWDDEPRLSGAYFWNWFGWGGPTSVEYTPRGKPAAQEIASWYLPAVDRKPDEP